VLIAAAQSVSPAFDFVPCIITAAEWRHLEAGLVQRVTALNLFLLDIYGEQRCLRDGVLPADLVYSRREYERELRGVVPPAACTRTWSAPTSSATAGASTSSSRTIVAARAGCPGIGLGRTSRDHSIT
jgi:uncharacterized circularly permuted ATP-grasp superfamily protein